MKTSLIILYILLKGKKAYHELYTYDIRKNLIYLPLIEDLETYKINEMGSALSRRRSLFRKPTSLENIKNDDNEIFYENYWDFNAFKENFDEASKNFENLSLQNIDDRKNHFEELPRTSKDTNTNLSNNFLKIPNEELMSEKFTPLCSAENPRILEFLGETESKQWDAESRNSFNNNDFSPIREFSLLKHSLMNNVYKNKSLIKIQPVPIDMEEEEKNSKPKSEDELIHEENSSRFSRMFENQEKKIKEIKKKDNSKDLSNISFASSKKLSGLSSPEKIKNDNNNEFNKSQINPKSSFFNKNGSDLFSKPSFTIINEVKTTPKENKNVFFFIYLKNYH